MVIIYCFPPAFILRSVMQGPSGKSELVTELSSYINKDTHESMHIRVLYVCTVLVTHTRDWYCKGTTF